MIFYDEYINESKGFNQNRSETSKIAALANNPNHKLYNEFDDKSKKRFIKLTREERDAYNRVANDSATPNDEIVNHKSHIHTQNKIKKQINDRKTKDLEIKNECCAIFNKKYLIKNGYLTEGFLINKKINLIQ